VALPDDAVAQGGEQRIGLGGGQPSRVEQQLGIGQREGAQVQLGSESG
jgi:hypothetical protein